MDKKYRRWYIKWPGEPYAFGPVDYQAHVTEKQVRACVRSGHAVKRLPVGFECWPDERQSK